MSRPTEDELEDPAETGRVGCLIPDIWDDIEGGSDDDGEDDD